LREAFLLSRRLAYRQHQITVTRLLKADKYYSVINQTYLSQELTAA